MHMKRLHVLSALVCVAVAIAVVILTRTDSNDLPEQYQIGRAVIPVNVDGRLGSEEWDSAQEIAPVQVTSGAGAETTSIRLLYDADFLYLSVVCSDSQITERRDDFWKNDSVRASIGMGVAETDDAFRFGFTATPQGLVSARFHKGRTPPSGATTDITKPLAPDLYQLACVVDDTGWSMELALSWSAVRPLPVPPDPFSLFIERRNINGDKIDVADWPYDSKVQFQFKRQTIDEEAPTSASSPASGS